ncbi:MAG: hypothetical protein Q8Q08_12965 [Candidatus Omnitrophota bacterium]|nr:hypothetical protein [Candidatus Omnitrophota bacterium]
MPSFLLRDQNRVELATFQDEMEARIAMEDQSMKDKGAKTRRNLYLIRIEAGIGIEIARRIISNRYGGPRRDE